MTISEIDLSKFKGQKSSLYTGRPQGQSARAELHLDNIDKAEDTSIVLVIPDGTTSFNPSFYLGLLYKSYKSLGLEGFTKKYSFDIRVVDEVTKNGILRNLEDGMRNAINSMNNRTGLSPFLT
jgi:hypothetical protein